MIELLADQKEWNEILHKSSVVVDLTTAGEKHDLILEEAVNLYEMLKSFEPSQSSCDVTEESPSSVSSPVSSPPSSPFISNYIPDSPVSASASTSDCSEEETISTEKAGSYQAFTLEKMDRVGGTDRGQVGLHCAVATTVDCTGPKKRRRRARAPAPYVDKLFCHSCGETKTSEWRRGPDGYKSLCNACGIHFATIVKKERLNTPRNEGFSFNMLLNSKEAPDTPEHSVFPRIPTKANTHPTISTFKYVAPPSKINNVLPERPVNAALPFPGTLAKVAIGLGHFRAKPMAASVQ